MNVKPGATQLALSGFVLSLLVSVTLSRWGTGVMCAVLMAGTNFSIIAGIVMALGPRLSLLQVLIVFVIASIEYGTKHHFIRPLCASTT